MSPAEERQAHEALERLAEHAGVLAQSDVTILRDALIQWRHDYDYSMRLAHLLTEANRE